MIFELLLFVCIFTISKGSNAPYYLIEVKSSSSYDAALNGCYERTGKNSVNDYHPASSYPIYQQVGKLKFYLFLENSQTACWIFASDFNGTNVKYRKR